MFPQRLDFPLAYAVAKAILDGFNRHDRLFRAEPARTRHRSRTADWHGQRHARRERIGFCALSVHECAWRRAREFQADQQPSDIWPQVKLHDIGLLVGHFPPASAGTLFNSVTTRILDRARSHNTVIFVRHAVSTESSENMESAGRPSDRADDPARSHLADAVAGLVRDFDLRAPFENLPRDAAWVADAMRAQHAGVPLRADVQIQVPCGLFFHNKGADAVGKVTNGFREIPFALPIRHVGSKGQPPRLGVDTVLFGEDDLLMLFISRGPASATTSSNPPTVISGTYRRRTRTTSCPASRGSPCIQSMSFPSPLRLSCSAVRRCANHSFDITRICWPRRSGNSTTSASGQATCTTCFPTGRPSASRHTGLRPTIP